MKGMMNSPGESIARGLEREAYVMGTPFEDAVVMRAAEDLAFGVRSKPQGTTEAERDLAMAAAAAKAEVEQRAVAAAQAEAAAVAQRAAAAAQSEATQRFVDEMTAKEEANRRNLEANQRAFEQIEKEMKVRAEEQRQQMKEPSRSKLLS